MGIWDKLFGNREPSAEREQREAEGRAMQEQEASAPESEVRRVKKFAIVLGPPERKGESSRLERWEIVKIDDQTGEVTVRKEGAGEETLSHEEFWNLNFPKSDEMLDKLMGARKAIATRTMAGSETLARQNAADLAQIDKIVEAFKAGNLAPMKEYFDELKARKEQAVAVAAKHLREVGPLSEKPEAEMTKEEKEEEVVKLARREQAAELREKAAESREKANEAQAAGDFKKMQIFLKEAGDWGDMAGRIEKTDVTRAQDDLARAENDPDLEKFTSFVIELKKEIAARRKRRSAAA